MKVPTKATTMNKLQEILLTGEKSREKIKDYVYEVNEDSSPQYKMSANTKFNSLIKRFRDAGNQIIFRRGVLEHFK